MTTKITHPPDRRGGATPEVWLTSDTHYGHANIIKYAKRPFADVREMNEAMIQNWNSVVRPGDLVYHLGDFAFCEPDEARRIIGRLHGQKFLVWGNHDKALRKDQAFCDAWQWCRDLTQIEVAGQKIILCHYAMRVWNQSHRGSWQLYGHSHGSLPDDKHSLSLDVGVDCWDYQPVNFEIIRSEMSKKDYEPVDQHGRRDD